MNRSTAVTIVVNESRTGRHYSRNYDRLIADNRGPLLAVIDSECDDGTSGNIVVNALLGIQHVLMEAVDAGPDAALKVLSDALRAANDAGLSIPCGEPGYGGGASVTVVSQSGKHGLVAHVGDCRLYCREHGLWVRKTVDHTLREATRCAAAGGPQSLHVGFEALTNIVTRAIGIAETVEIDTFCFSVDQCAEILLCTRGAWLPLDPAGDGFPLSIQAPATQIADEIFRRYTEDGERDNASIIVASFGHPTIPGVQ